MIEEFEKLFPFLKRFSGKIAENTKYFQFACFASFFCLMSLIAIVFPTDFPRSLTFRFGIGFLVWGIACGLIAFFFWYLPFQKVETKKKEGKDWSGALTGCNLFITNSFTGPVCGLFLFLGAISIGGTQSYIQPPPIAYINERKCQEEVKVFFEENITKDQEKAIECWTMAADQGDALRQSLLGILYFNGKGVPQDDKKAIEYFTLAANQGDAASQFFLGICYEDGRGVAQDYKKATHYYTLAANQSDAASQFVLGRCYQSGKGVTQDFKKATHYYTLAANQGLARAQFKLGNCYENGKGVPQDDKKAIEYYILAADQGDAEAAYRVSLFLRKDKHESIKWLRIAAYEGSNEAKKTLRQYGREPCSFWGEIWFLIKVLFGGTDEQRARFNRGFEKTKREFEEKKRQFFAS